MKYREFQEVEKTYQEKFKIYNKRRKFFFKWYFKLYHRLEIRGREHIPEGPALIIPNHTGGYDLDLLALADFAVEDRDVTPMIIQSWHYCNNWWGRWYVGSGLPLYQGKGMQFDYYDPYFTPGGERFPGLMVLFPEGNIKTFGDRRRLGKFYPGALRLAVKYRIPLIPAAMVGFDTASPVMKALPHEGRPDDVLIFPFTFPKKLIVEFGEPIALNSHHDFSYSKEEEFRISNEEIRPHLQRLLEKYHAVECDPWE